MWSNKKRIRRQAAQPVTKNLPVNPPPKPSAALGRNYAPMSTDAMASDRCNRGSVHGRLGPSLHVRAKSPKRRPGDRGKVEVLWCN